MAPPDTSTYRQALILLAGFTATCAALLIHQRYSKPEIPASGTGLHRSNAIRRPNARRRRHADESGLSGSTASVTVSELAISHLLVRDASGDGYGAFAPEVTTDTLSVEALPGFRLLPSQLPSVAYLRSLDAIPEIVAQQAQRRIHREFMYNFLAQEYPQGHLIQGEEADYLRDRLTNLNVDAGVVEACVADFNAGRISGLPVADLMAGGSLGLHPTGTQRLQRLTESLGYADGANETNHDAVTQGIDTRETVADDQSHVSRNHTSDSEGDEEGHNVKSLVYRIAEDSARRENYVHRGVMCNGCRIQPIQGIRYSCANCPDYDLCEECEAHQIHIKTHIFYKVRIPAPLLGYHRPTAPIWYPGKPHLLSEQLRHKFPEELKKRLERKYSLENAEFQAHWEQFICLAGCEWAEDPKRLGLAIDRDGFDKCFCPPTSLRSPPPNLLYDRLFSFYDTNNDGKIGFEEFLRGLVNLQDKSRDAKLRRIFRAYDLDGDGFVCRKDFLRLFRAYYSFSKEMAKASIAALDNREDPYTRDADRDEVRRRVEGGRPISAIFEGIPAGHTSRSWVGKSHSPDANGDLTIVDRNGVLDEDSEDINDRNDIIGDAALGDRPFGSPFRSFRPRSSSNEFAREEVPITHPDDADITPSGSDAGLGHMYGWPPINNVEPEDILSALGWDVPVEEVMDPVDRARVFYAQSQRLDAEADRTTESIRQRAIQNRWQKQDFYTDFEEGATAPPGYVEADSSDDEADGDVGGASLDSISDSRRRSLRSRSSSKVRFEDSITETDYETRSNTSSRSIPAGERWGGYEVKDIEKDVGKEVLYQVIQQGFNELLDPLFKEKEDLAVAANATRRLRRQWAYKIHEHNKPEYLSMLARRSEEALMYGRPMEWDGPIPFPGETASINTPSSSSSSTPSSSSSNPDPTMPQNGPDMPPLANSNEAKNSPASLPTISRAARLASRNEADTQTTPRKSTIPLPQYPSIPLPPAPDPEPSAEMLDLWVKHDKADAEAKQRGGHGKLSFEEFVKKMVDEDSTTAALGRDGDKDEAEQKWGESASLGPLWFVGTWIEQASF
jgi:hypothetical protein